MRLDSRSIFRLFFFCGILLWLPHGSLAFVTEIEPNDVFENPNPLACGDTVLCASLPDGDVDHFRILALGGDSLYLRSFNCSGSSTNTLMVLFNDDFQIVAVDNDDGPEWFSTIGIWVPQTAYYTLRVMRTGTQTDTTYNLFVDCVTPNAVSFDNCETPRIAPSLPYYDEGSTYGMSDDVGTPAPDVFYRFTQPILSDVRIEVCSEFWDARVQIILYCIGGFRDDESEGCQSGATLTTFGLQPGDYYVVVEGTSALEYGDYSIEISPVFPDCLEPFNVVLFSVGDMPSLDWPNVPGADYYLISQSANANGPFEHLDTTYISFYQDPAGFSATLKFYTVRTICTWGQ
jgi:hypothetical protein